MYQLIISQWMNDGKVEVTDGPYAETKEMLGGILLLEARDLNHAVALMSKHPGVKMGPFEIGCNRRSACGTELEKGAIFERLMGASSWVGWSVSLGGARSRPARRAIFCVEWQCSA